MSEMQQGAVGDVRSLVVAREQGMAERPAEAGVQRLARMSEDNFTEHLELLKVGYSRLKQVQRTLMKPGVHFGMPGAKPEQLAKLVEEGKVGLYKAGAEVLCQMLGFVAGRPDLQITYGDPDNESSPAIVVHASVPIHRGDTSGPTVGVGVGAWSTWEIKNRYRRTQRVCPTCGKPALMKQAEAKGGPFKGQPAFWCAPFKDGCGGNFAGNDPNIVDQAEGREVNRDAADLLNTGVKMGTKRAYVDGVIRASGSSDLFTQDVEDMKPEDLKQHSREVDAGAEATVNAMYGGGDDWRDEVQKSAAAPAKPNPPAGPVAPPAEKPASDRQKSALRTLLSMKLGCTDETFDAGLQQYGIISGLEAISAFDASKMIGALNKQPDMPKDAAAPAAPTREQAIATQPARQETSTTEADGPLADTQANRDFLLDSIRMHAAELEGMHRGRKIISVEEGVGHLVGGNELAVLRMTRPIELSYLDVQQLWTLAQYLKAEIGRKAQATR